MQIDTKSDKTHLLIDKSDRDDSGRYTVFASNDYGSDSADIEVTVVDRPGPPQSPLKYLTTGPEAITMCWNPPIDNGGSVIIGYIVEIADYGTDNWRKAQGYVQGCSFTAKGLIENKRYIFRVRAENAIGVSEPLEGKPVAAKSPYDPPDPPSTPEILGYTPNSCSLAWRPPTNTGGKPIIGKNIFQSFNFKSVELRDKKNATQFCCNFRIHC